MDDSHFLTLLSSLYKVLAIIASVPLGNLHKANASSHLHHCRWELQEQIKDIIHQGTWGEQGTEMREGGISSEHDAVRPCARRPPRYP